MPAFRCRRFLGLITATLCVWATALRAAPAEAHFIDSLSPTEQTASGIAKLSAGERSALDDQIAREIALARQGDVVAFAKSFNERRTSAQVDAAGLATLSPGERAQLDVLIARAVARRPAADITRFSNKSSSEGVETVTYRPQLHGEVSLTYGMASGGRNFYGGSFTTIYDDPAHNLTVAFTYSEFHGKGLLPSCGGEPAGYLR
jgi:hypothetical protein